MLINSYRFLKSLEFLFSLRRLNPSATNSIRVIENSSEVDVKFDASGDLDISLPPVFLVSSANYTGTSLDITGQDATPTGIFFSPDGLNLYMVGGSSDSIHQYLLTTAWDISTTNVNLVRSLDISGQDLGSQGIFFSPDGFNLYMVGLDSDKIHQYSLTTAWDISITNVSFVRSLDISGQDATPRGMFFSSDGFNLYMVGVDSDSIHQYSLTTAWDISTSSIIKSLDISGQEGNPRGIFFSLDGFNLYMVGITSKSIHQYSLTTSWDISSATYTNTSLDISGQNTFPTGIFFSPDGLNLYMVGGEGGGLATQSINTK